MSTPASGPTPPWQSTEVIPSDTEQTRPLPPRGTPQPPRGTTPQPSPGESAPADPTAGPTSGSHGTAAPTATGHGATAADGLFHDPEHPGDRVAPREWHALSPKTLFFGTLDLVVDALVNFVLVVVLITVVATGIALIPAAGIGLVLLVLTVYAMMAVVWLERRRSASSFGLDLRDPVRRSTPRTDWVRVPHQWWLDASDGSLWLGVLHLLLTLCLGVIATLTVAGLGAMAVTAVAPAFVPENSVLWNVFNFTDRAPAWLFVGGGILAVIVGLLLLLLLVMAHRGLSATLLRMSGPAALRREAAESARRAEYASAARESAVRGAHTERSRIERDLHDGVQPQLVSVAMNLSMAGSRIDTDPAAAKQLVAEAHGTTKAAITELRRLARGFHPAVLEDRGLDAALSAIAAQAPFPVRVNVDVPRLNPETEAAVYFAVSESLTNAIKHSGARSAEVGVSVQRDHPYGPATVVAGIRDHGRGGAHVVPGGGLSGIEDRVRSAGGRFFLNSFPGGPTEVIVQLPLTDVPRGTGWPAGGAGGHVRTGGADPDDGREGYGSRPSGTSGTGWEV